MHYELIDTKLSLLKYSQIILYYGLSSLFTFCSPLQSSVSFLLIEALLYIGGLAVIFSRSLYLDILYISFIIL